MQQTRCFPEKDPVCLTNCTNNKKNYKGLTHCWWNCKINNDVELLGYIMLILFTIGFGTMFIGYHGPYMEYLKYKNDFIEAKCIAGPNYKTHTANGIDCAYDYDGIEKRCSNDGIWLIYEGVTASVYNATLNETITINNVRIRNPSTTYQIVYNIAGSYVKIETDYFRKTRKCLIPVPIKISPTEYGLPESGIIRINFKIRIEAVYFTGVAGFTIMMLLIFRLLYKHIIYAIYYYGYGLCAIIKYIFNGILYNFCCCTSYYRNHKYRNMVDKSIVINTDYGINLQDITTSDITVTRQSKKSANIPGAKLPKAMSYEDDV